MEKKIKISELLIDSTMSLNIIEVETLDEVAHELSIIRHELGTPIVVSKRSGYRPKAYELSKGRTGNSEHTTYNIKGRGAVDLVYYPELLQKLIERKFFTRICYYPNNNFIHADRKPIAKRSYFEAESPTSDWVFKKHI